MFHLKKDSHKDNFLSKPPSLKKLYPGSGKKMPKELQSSFEQMSAISFENVRIHYASSRPAAINALAYAQGNHVYLGPGQERHLPHELGHVLQQRQGRVRPTMQIGGMQVNRDAFLEREADMLGHQAQRFHINQEASQPYIEDRKAVQLRVGSRENKLYMGGGGALQLRTGIEENVVAQLEGHVQYGTENAVVPPEAVQPANPPINQENPTIYYESFGGDRAQLLNIYRQSCTYPGRTVCILGLNQKSGNPPDEGLERELASLKDDIQRGYMEGHDACLIPFTWKDTADEGGYTFPYFEVRSELMRIAEAHAEEIAANHAEKLADNPRFVEWYTARYREKNQKEPTEENIKGYAVKLAEEKWIKKALFRWIDRDASDDTTGGLNGLRELADDGKPTIYTGAYNWDTSQWDTEVRGNAAVERKRIKKSVFFKKINECERELRAYYWGLHQKLVVHGTEKFYLPEPTLLMNHKAHQIMRNNLEQEWVDRQRRNKVHDGQQRESEVALGGAGNAMIGADRREDKIQVIYKEALSVTKPNKTIPRSEATYLGNIEEWVQNRNDARESLQVQLHNIATTLKKLRQSAFDNSQWHFLSGSDSANWENASDSEPLMEDFCPAATLQEALNWKRKELAGRLLDVLNS